MTHKSVATSIFCASAMLFDHPLHVLLSSWNSAKMLGESILPTSNRAGQFLTTYIHAGRGDTRLLSPQEQFDRMDDLLKISHQRETCSLRIFRVSEGEKRHYFHRWIMRAGSGYMAWALPSRRSHLQPRFLILLGQVAVHDEVEQRSRSGWLSSFLPEERSNVAAVHSQEVHRPRVFIFHRLWR